MAASSTSCIARDACSSIVKHYSDPIHYTVDGDKKGESAPYFDPVLGQPCIPDLSPFCQVWYRRLLGVSQHGTRSKANDLISCSVKFDAARELLCCYQSIIRPCVAQQIVDIDADIPNKKSKQVPIDAILEILHNYELLITHLLRNVPDQSNNRHEDQVVQMIGKAIMTIVDDTLCRAGNLPNDDRNALTKVQNLILPSLLRLLSHCVKLLGLASSHESSQNTLWKEILAISTVISVPFVGDGRLKSGEFCIGSLLDWINTGSSAEALTNPLSVAHTIQHCRPSPTTCDQTLMSSDFATRSVVDFSVSAAQFKAPWTDGISGIGYRMGISLLNMIHQNLRASSAGEKATESKNCVTGTQGVKLLLCEISQGIGVDILLPTIRAFFFGRLCFPISSAANANNAVSCPKGPFLPMIQRMQTKPAAVPSSTKELPHVENKMRLSLVSIMFCVMYDQPCNVDFLDKAFLDTIPIVLKLLDDVTPYNQAVGALVFLSIMKASDDLTDMPSFFERFHVIITRSLGTAIQFCEREDATILAVICLAQSKWFKLLRRYLLNVPRSTSSSNGALSTAGICLSMRTAAAHLLDTARRQTQSGRQDGGDVRISAALVAGINPLLELLAEFPEAASTEIGRVGLSVLLPLVGWRGMSLESRSIQTAAVCGLISLMNGAYPIMNNHGTKVMVELVALLHRARIDADFLSKTPAKNCSQVNDEISTVLTRKLALYAAAIALIVCGGGAEDVLSHVESKKAIDQNSSDVLIQMCQEIRALTAKMKKTTD